VRSVNALGVEQRDEAARDVGERGDRRIIRRKDAKARREEANLLEGELGASECAAEQQHALESRDPIGSRHRLPIARPRTPLTAADSARPDPG
jgi:hypothetical protein